MKQREALAPLLAAVFFVIAARVAAEEADRPSKSKMLSAEGGRFVFGQISEYRRDQYMLDTKTGRLWQPVHVTSDSDKEGYVVLSPVLYERGRREDETASLTPDGPVGKRDR